MTKEKFGIVLPVTLLAYFLILMDNSIIFTSATQIGQSFEMSATSLSWVSNAYTLTFGGFLLLSGRLSDMLGRKRIFLIGLAIFGASSLLIGLSQGAEMMIIMRAVQGIGSSIIAPTTLALIMDTYQKKRRQIAISYYGATAGIGASIGLLLGGGLTSLVSWRAGFIINVPFTLVLIYLTQKFVADYDVRKIRIDYLGSLLSIIGLVGIIYGFTESRLLFISLGVVFLVLFIFRELHVAYPLLPLFLFKNKVRAGAYIARLLIMMTMLPFWFFLPQMLQSQYGFSAFLSGVSFLPLTIVNFIVALQLPKLTAKFGNGRVLFVGELMLLVGLLMLATTDLQQGYWGAIFIPMLILGLGQGLILAPVTSAGIHDAPVAVAGIASGLTNTMHQIGGPIGLSIIITTSSSFQQSVSLMALFTVFAGIIVGVMIIGGERK